MKNFYLVIAVILVSGCSRKVYVPVEKEVMVKEVVRDTAIVVKLEQQTDTVVVKESVAHEAHSYLKNKYCETSAVFYQGELKHTLATLPDASDTVVVTKYKEVEKTVKEPQIVEVCRELIGPDCVICAFHSASNKRL